MTASDEGARRPHRAPGTASALSFVPLVVMLATAAVASGACGGDGKPPTPTALAGTATPAEDSLPGRSLDLANAPLLIDIVGTGKEDLADGPPTLAGGDFNGDGVQDVLIGAPLADGPGDSRENAGEAYVVFGAPQPAASLDLDAGEQDVTIFGGAAGDSLGYAVLAADINDDGADDVIVGAPGTTGEEDPRTSQGRTYIFFGSSTLAGDLDVAEGAQNVTVTGAEGFSRLGHALASGDVNGDDRPDLILGAPFAGREPGTPPGSPRTEVGEAYVVLGSPSLSGEIRIPDEDHDLTLAGEQQYSQFGEGVASADVNGDGFDDIIVGASQTDGPEGSRAAGGAAYVFFGSSNLGGRRSIAEKQQDITIWGASAGDSLGFPLTAADFNGDGTADIALAARLADGANDDRDQSGEVYVIFGRDDFADALDLASDPPDITVLGAGVGQLLATSMSAGDVTGDEIDDLILGASLSAGPDRRNGAGLVYLIEGGPEQPGKLDLAAGDQYLTIAGADAQDRLGGASALADFTGDGKDEIILLAALADGPEDARPDAGEVYALETPPGPGEP